MNERPNITSLPRAGEAKTNDRERHTLAVNAVLDAMAQGNRTRMTKDDSFDVEAIEAILAQVASRGQRRGILDAMAKDLGVSADEPESP